MSLPIQAKLPRVTRRGAAFSQERVFLRTVKMEVDGEVFFRNEIWRNRPIMDSPLTTRQQDMDSNLKGRL